MANLESLAQELRQLTVATSSSTGETEVRYRAILSQHLLSDSVRHATEANQGEFIAFLKLLICTTEVIPGVFYHGKASAILPFIRWILPFSAEPTFQSSHRVIFEAVASLLSLLGTGDKDAYCRFFVDIMIAVEDIFYVASVYNEESKQSCQISLTCFRESFGRISDPSHVILPLLGGLASHGLGMQVDLSGEGRWQPLVASLIKLACKCLTEGTRDVDGLLCLSFVSAACSLSSYEDTDLHMACFDLARIILTVSDNEIIPKEKLIRVITSILNEDEERLPVFSDEAYDSSIGECLHAIYSCCPNDFKSEASNMIAVFQETMQKTRSAKLKDALCNAYIRIAKTCPCNIWRPELLMHLLHSSNDSSGLVDCLRIAVSRIRLDIKEGTEVDILPPTPEPDGYASSRVGKRRLVQDPSSSVAKRLRIDEDVVLVNADFYGDLEESCGIEKEYSEHFSKLIRAYVESPIPSGGKAHSSELEVALTSLSMLCLVFCERPQTKFARGMFGRLRDWVPQICEQAKLDTSNPLDLKIFLEAVHDILLVESTLAEENKAFKIAGDSLDHMLSVLKLPWTRKLATTESTCNMKCLSLQVWSKMGCLLESEGQLEVLGLGIEDEAVEVNAEAVICMPVTVFWSGFAFVKRIFKRLPFLEKEMGEQARKMISLSIGYLACILGSHGDGPASKCKLYIAKDNFRHFSTADNLIQGFWCSKCDKKDVQNREMYSAIPLPEPQSTTSGLECDLDLQSLFFKLISDESSEKVQVTCVGMIQRILFHVPEEVLSQTRLNWIELINKLLLHSKRSVREAFSKQVNFFLEEPVLSCLFSDDEISSKEQNLLNKIRAAIKATDDPQIIETLLITTAEILVSDDIKSDLFSFTLFLLVDQLDNAHVPIKLMTSNLIRKSCYFQPKGGLEQILINVNPFRNELYYYLCCRLTDHPELVREFAESVLFVPTTELLQKMVPLVLPRLVTDEDSFTLDKLAECLNMDLVNLVVTWSTDVLAFALNQADGVKLKNALQFYHRRAGYGKEKLFSAALPALLDKLVCIIDVDLDETNGRLSTVHQMIKQVAKVVTDTEDLPSFLRTHFVDLLNSIDRKLLRTEDSSLQEQALKRIKMLIDMMGSHLSTYIPKIMVLLMYSIEKESLQTEGLCVLHFFIEKLVQVSPSTTKHIISQVFAALLPMLQRDEIHSSSNLSKIVEILKELVIENKDILKQHIQGFLHLPCISSLEEVNKVIKEARGSMTSKDILSDIVAGLNHENLNVRHMVACELRGLLKLSREGVTSLVAKEVGSDLDMLSSLITTVLRGCAGESRSSVGHRLKLVCADCLGALGAVDPAKVEGGTSQRFRMASSDDDLIFELIHKHLARAFRAASDTFIQDSAAVAIQELLKIAECEASVDDSLEQSSGVSKTKRGQRLWYRFSSDVKEIIAPYLTSRLQLPNTGVCASAGPIYQPSMSFARWIFLWMNRLSALAGGTRAGIFTACRDVVRHDMQTAKYLLPYLILNAGCLGTEEVRRGIIEEISYVLDPDAASVNNTAAIQGNNSRQSEVCIHSVFALLDNLRQWVDDFKPDLALSQATQSSNPQQQASEVKDTTASGLELKQSEYVSKLFAEIPKVTLAKASLRCQDYARSLLYFESHVRDKSGSFNPAAEKSGVFLDEDVSFLMEVYRNLDEPDGLSGLACLRKSRSLQDELLIHKKSGNWVDVLTSYEQASQIEPNSVHRHSDVLNCHLNMSHFQTMVIHVDGLISRVPQYKKTWCMQGVQAAWRLGRWDLMDEYLDGADKEDLLCSSTERSASFDMDVAKILQAIMKKENSAVSERIALSKQALIAPLSVAARHSYTQAYPLIVKLHMLKELEDFHTLLEGKSSLEKPFTASEPGFAEVTKNWEDRLRCTQPSLWTREPLLALRRVVFGSSGFGARVENYWLQYAKLCRSAGHFETANRAISEAMELSSPNVHREKAKLLWSTKRYNSAIAELQQNLLNMPMEVLGSAAMASISSSYSLTSPPLIGTDTQFLKQCLDTAKTLLLYTKWIHSTGQKQKIDVMRLYYTVTEMQPEWEKGHFYMAKYLDELLVDARKRQENSTTASSSLSNEKPWWTYVKDVLESYRRGLAKGHKNIFQALPRLLTLWFEFENFCFSSPFKSEEWKETRQKVYDIMKDCSNNLPPYYWFTVLPQLISTICHQNPLINQVVQKLITTVLQKFPQQALWIMVPVLKSEVTSKREAAAKIIKAAKGSSQGNGSSSLFDNFATFIDHLIEFCSHEYPKDARAIDIPTGFSALKKIPGGIIMPLQQSLTINVPTYSMNLDDFQGSDIFSSAELPTIVGIANEAEILKSAQRPKKVFLLGSDGISRPFLCKSKDDLRKDARIMDFNATANRLLSMSPESRRRKLYIRTFAVIPLKEDCGIIEWVPHTRALRTILEGIYFNSENDKLETYTRIQKIYNVNKDMAADEFLKNKLLSKFAPSFHKWFLKTFPEPAVWFKARVAYAQTTAVSSMVGHIVGLGDRHSENILFDSTTGDCVHVDFSCLFDRGLKLKVPELVPFRLTQNVIDGLGITGYEGVFLKVCEITLSVLRAHRETLMSVLQTFIHDPLMEWTKPHTSSGRQVQNPHAQRAIHNIDARLRGVILGVGGEPSSPLSADVQARCLIAEAVSHKNLGKMYIWWMPWF